MKPKILFVSDRIPFPKHFNGATLITYNVINELKETYDIDFLCFESNGQIHKNELVSRYFRDIHFFPHPKKQRFSKLTSLLTFRPAFDLNKSEELQKLVEELAQNESYHTVVTDLLDLTPYTNQISHNNKILLNHDSITLFFQTLFKKEKNFFKKIYYYNRFLTYRRYEKKVLNRYRKCVFVSEKDLTYSQFFCPGINAVSIPNGVDTKDFYPNEKAEIKINRLIFTGIMDYPPNVDAVKYFVSEILPEIEKKIPSIEFYIVGKNPSNEVKALSNRNNVFVTGFVDDIKQEIWKSHIYVCPMRSGAGMKNKILEAMACGIPIVTTSIGTEGIDIKDQVHVCIADTTKSFVAEVIKTIDPSFAKTLINNSRELIDAKYSWKASCNKYLEIIK